MLYVSCWTQSDLERLTVGCCPAVVVELGLELCTGPLMGLAAAAGSIGGASAFDVDVTQYLWVLWCC